MKANSTWPLTRTCIEFIDVDKARATIYKTRKSEGAVYLVSGSDKPVSVIVNNSSVFYVPKDTPECVSDDVKQIVGNTGNAVPYRIIKYTLVEG